MARDGRITPDDYAIAESDYVQGSMVYQRLNRILEGEKFVSDLSAPEVTKEVKKFAREREEAQAQRAATSKASSQKKKVAGVTAGEESASLLEGLSSQFNFGQVFTFCCAVIGSAWAYNYVTSTEPAVTRVPAQAAPAVKAVAVEKPEDSIILSQPKKLERNPSRVERLMPSERPTARRPNNVPTARPEIAEIQPATRVDDRRSPDSDGRDLRPDDRYDDRDWDNRPQNEELLGADPGYDERDPRNLAGDDDGAWGNTLLPDDMPRPGEVMPNTESGWENELPPEEWEGDYYDGDMEDL